MIRPTAWVRQFGTGTPNAYTANDLFAITDFDVLSRMGAEVGGGSGKLRVFTKGITLDANRAAILRTDLRTWHQEAELTADLALVGADRLAAVQLSIDVLLLPDGYGSVLTMGRHDGGPELEEQQP